MIVFPLLAAGFIMKLIAVAFIICGVALILIVLIQKGKGGGLSAAFGGGMPTGLLGSKTGDFLTWMTIGLVSVFLFLAVLMAKFYRPSVSSYGQDQQTTSSQQQPSQETAPSMPSQTELPAETNAVK
jgi:preprotein translocase subunit SecG